MLSNHPSSDSSLFNPTAAPNHWVDAEGNIYIADYDNDVVRKVTAKTGIITTVAGIMGSSDFTGDGGPATSAQLSHPQGVVVDSEGNFYISDGANARIRKVTAKTGIITTVVGTGTSGMSGDGGPGTSAQINYPEEMVIDPKGNLIFADNSNHAIRKFDVTTGIVTTVAGTLGSSGSSGDGGPATSAYLNGPAGVEVDKSGNIYIADSSNNSIRRVDARTGIITTIAGTTGASGASTGDGGPATSAFFNFPTSVALDNLGRLYVMDSYSCAVRMINLTTGIITRVAGQIDDWQNPAAGDGGPATSAGLYYASALALDSAGNFYVADTGNFIIRKVNVSTGIITRVAGNNGGSEQSSGDGGPATLAGLSDIFPWSY